MTVMADTATLLGVEKLTRYYGSGRNRWFGNHERVLKAVDGVSFGVNASETVGIVGESGCGKSTLLRCMVAVEEITSGVVKFEGRDVSRMAPRERQRYRRLVQLVFQDPTASLNPRQTDR